MTSTTSIFLPSMTTQIIQSQTIERLFSCDAERFEEYYLLNVGHQKYR